MITPQDLDKMRELSMDLTDFVFCGLFQLYKGNVTVEEMGSSVGYGELPLLEIVHRLKMGGWVEVGPRSGKVKVTAKWKDATKIEKQEKVANPLINLMRLAIISPERKENRTGYQWSSSEGKWAGEVSLKLINTFKAKNPIEPTNEQIIQLFCQILDNLSDHWNNRFSMFNMNIFYNDIINSAREVIQKNKASGKTLNNVMAIRQASENFVPERFR